LPVALYIFIVIYLVLFNRRRVSGVPAKLLHDRKACRRHGFCTHSATLAHATAHKTVRQPTKNFTTAL